ncbi:preprotein translocase subunit SecE [uncultured Slackia sp.]|uniref:preprotein translocase subunit SecE n=1 Tax=uncultured Slackia sp. TaxID=665903 RepID=UPI0026DF34E3|nr:preprotein translocase subunit SecE [uncultured Slackia sp.]
MKSEYYVWIAGVAFALAAFAVAIMAVGYQPLTFGRGATVAALVVVGAVSLALRRRGRN